MSGKCPFSFLSRRAFIKSATGGAGLLAASSALGSVASHVSTAPVPHSNHNAQIPFLGAYQAGIATPQQAHTYFAAFDVVTDQRDEVIALLKDWTEASARLTQGKTVDIKLRKRRTKTPDEATDSYADAHDAASTVDSGEAQSLPTGRLTLTFGFGSGLFITKGGIDRFGLSKFRPEALVDMPVFHGDELIESKTGGDLSVQACSDDPQVAFHAIRQLARFAEGVANIRWVQTGFVSGAGRPETPRNLMGFKDGTQQPKTNEYSQFVWVGKNGPKWMQNGTYLVTRRIRIALEHWDQTDVAFQEQVIGRKKDSGVPIGQKREKEQLNLKAVDSEGNALIAENSHVRLASAEANGGAQILRRGYSYNEGVNYTAERWPPWKQGLEYDAGLFFISYQPDPRSGFIQIFRNMSKLDALNQFVTHVGSGLFACPPGVQAGEYIGQKLFESVHI